MYFTQDKLQIHYSEIREVLAEAIRKSPNNENVVKLRAGFHYIMNHLIDNEMRLKRTEMELDSVYAELREELKKSLLKTN